VICELEADQVSLCKDVISTLKARP